MVLFSEVMLRKVKKGRLGKLRVSDFEMIGRYYWWFQTYILPQHQNPAPYHYLEFCVLFLLTWCNNLSFSIFLKDSTMASTSLFKRFKEFTEYTTTQGLVYIFSKDISSFGKTFWILAVTLMFSIGMFWTVEMYTNWDDQQVLLKMNWNKNSKLTNADSLACIGRTWKIIRTIFFKLSWI